MRGVIEPEKRDLDYDLKDQPHNNDPYFLSGKDNNTDKAAGISSPPSIKKSIVNDIGSSTGSDEDSFGPDGVGEQPGAPSLGKSQDKSYRELSDKFLPGGGPAQKTKDSKNKEGSGKTEKSDKSSSKIGKTAEKVSSAAKGLKENLEKIEKVKKAIAFVRNIGLIIANFWPVIIIVAILLFALVLFTVLYSRANSSPSASGSSMTVAVDPLTDKDLLRKILILSGDSATLNKFSQDQIKSLSGQLTGLKEFTDDTTDAKIDAVVAKLKVFNPSVNKTDGANIIKEIKAIVGTLNTCAKVAVHPNVTVKNADDKKGLLAGNSMRKDGTFTPLDQGMCKMLLALADNASTIGISKVNILVLTRAHGKTVKKTTITSMHYYGKGVDLSMDDSDKIMKWIVQNEQTLKQQNAFPKQSIGPDKDCDWQINRGVQAKCWYDNAKHNYDHDKNNPHIHIGF